MVIFQEVKLRLKNMDDLWTHYAEWKKPDTKGHIQYDPIYEISTVGKSIGTEIRSVVIRGWGRREWLLNGCRVAFVGDEKVLELDSSDVTQHYNTEMYTLKWLK